MANHHEARGLRLRSCRPEGGALRGDCVLAIESNLVSGWWAERGGRPGVPPAPLGGRAQYATVRWSCTEVTPGAAQAASIASSCSAQELTVPLTVTVPLSVETCRSSASSAALRLNALLIDSFTSPRSGVGYSSSISSKTSSAPTMLEATKSASSRWYCQLVVPVRVTKPSSTFASTVFGTRLSSISA